MPLSPPGPAFDRIDNDRFLKRITSGISDYVFHNHEVKLSKLFQKTIENLNRYGHTHDLNIAQEIEMLYSTITVKAQRP